MCCNHNTSSSLFGSFVNLQGLSISDINCARSGPSTYLWQENGTTAYGGQFYGNSPKTEYSQIWDISIVLTLLKNWAPATALSLQVLTFFQNYHADGLGHGTKDSVPTKLRLDN